MLNCATENNELELAKYMGRKLNNKHVCITNYGVQLNFW